MTVHHLELWIFDKLCELTTFTTTFFGPEHTNHTVEARMEVGTLK